MLLFAADPIDHVTDKYLFEVAEGVPFTMHMVTIVVVGALFVFAMMSAAKRIATGPESEGNDRYITKGRWAQFVEALVCYLRDEMLEPVLGKEHTRRYLPFLMTLFFFVLFNNVFGLIPIMDLIHLVGEVTGAHFKTYIGGTATSNIAITGALALVSFVVIQIHGVRENGVGGWLIHNFAGLVPGPIYLFPVALIVFFVEMVGHLIKPAALAIRLFANMVAGHTLLAVLLSFGGVAAKAAGGLTAGAIGITLVSGVAGVLIMFLEVFVAFLQAFIFMFLTAVFMSLLSHHDEDHEHDDSHEHSAEVAHA